MNKIKVLPEIIANKIAAGEVVERPASVVKELVENAIDGGASRVTVEIKGGGISMIRVSDDGCGMSRDDAVMSLERHATSKIGDVDDIYVIRSLGFRGEALPSIASVSRFELASCEGGNVPGTKISVDGGKVGEIREAGMSKGTVVTVQDLFFNVPARRKFLKTHQTETGHILNVVTLSALAHTAVAFKLVDNGKEVVAIEKGMDLKARVGALYGADFADALLPVDWKSLAVRISGYISKPEFTFSNKSKEYFFVNERPVQNRTLLYAVSEGYRTLMSNDRNPFCFLFISIDPSHIDVNIHPTKREIKFLNDTTVRDAVVQAVRSSLEANYDMPVFGSGEAPDPDAQPCAGSVQDAMKRYFETPPGAGAYTKPTYPAGPATGIGARQPAGDQPLPHPAFMSAAVSKKAPFVIGQTHSLYLVAEAADGIVIIDQHAAHERVLYEKTMEAIREKKLDVQRLLLPVTIELPKATAVFVTEHLGSLENAGVGISLFGQNGFIVDAVPAFAQNSDVTRLVRDLIEELEETSLATKADAAFEEKVVKTLCRLAVKSKDKLDQKEQIRLVEDLFRCGVPQTCPHGRPTMIKLSNDTLAKEFKRR